MPWPSCSPLLHCSLKGQRSFADASFLCTLWSSLRSQPIGLIKCSAAPFLWNLPSCSMSNLFAPSQPSERACTSVDGTYANDEHRISLSLRLTLQGENLRCAAEAACSSHECSQTQKELGKRRAVFFPSLEARRLGVPTRRRATKARSTS